MPDRLFCHLLLSSEHYANVNLTLDPLPAMRNPESLWGSKKKMLLLFQGYLSHNRKPQQTEKGRHLAV